MRSRPMRIGAVQLRIMRVLWKHGRATARQITDELSRERPIAHSTVQTLLRKLEKKGSVSHTVQGRLFVFRALVSEEEVMTAATGDLLQRLFDGSVYGLVAHLVSGERVPPEEMARIRELITGEGGCDGTGSD